MSIPSQTSTVDDVNNTSVYRLPPSRMFAVYLILALGVFFLLLFAWFPLSSQRSMAAEYPWVILTGFFLFDMCVYFFMALLRVRLITSPWGIEYYGLGVNLRAPWKNVVSLDKLRQGSELVDSLLVSQQGEMSWWMRASLTAWPMLRPLGILSGQWLSDLDSNKLGRSIPVAFFVGDWRHSSLGEEIRRYAPQVFGEQRREADTRTLTAGTTNLDATSNQAEAAQSVSSSDVAPGAFPIAHREEETRRGSSIKVIALAVVVVELLLAFFVAPSIYRSAQPMLGAANALPGRRFLNGAYGPSDLSRDGRLLAAGNQVVTFPEGTVKLTLPRRPDGTFLVESMALSADGKLLAVGDNEYGNASIWRVADGSLLQTFSVTSPTMRGHVYGVVFSPDGKRLAAVGPTGEIKVWNVEDGKLLSTMKSSETAVRFGAKLLFDPRGQQLISLIAGTLETWRVQDGSLVRKAGPGDWVENVAMSADGNTLALGTLHGGIFLWNVETGSVSRTVKEQNKSGSSAEAMYGIAISPDGKTVVSGSSQGGIQVWSVDGGSPKNMRDSSGTTVRWMAFSPDGSKLVYSKYDEGSIWVWVIRSATN